MIQREKLFKIFKEDNFYPICITSCENDKIRLTQGFTSLINKGFVLKTGKAIYPTHVKFQKVLENREAFECVLRDNDDHEYFLSIESNNVNDKVCCGYNKSGDQMIIWLKENVSFQKENSQWKGKIQVRRNSDYYSLIDTKGSKILTKALDGDFFNIFIDHNSINQQIFYSNQQKLQIIQKTQRYYYK